MIDPKQLQYLCRDLSLLYVEDEEEIRGHMSAILGNFFGEVRSAADGRAGLEAYRERPADVVITDIMMPVMDGLAMAREIKAIDPLQHLLIVSAYNETRFFSEAIRVGVDGFVLKPVEMEQLFEALHKAAIRIREHHENLDYRANLERRVAEQTEELARRLVTDELTGLPNRVQLQQELERGMETCLLLLNVDNLGHINDGYGFQTGNWVLQGLAAHLWERRPPDGTLYRLTSDEFVLALPGCGLQRAALEAERLQRELEGHHLHVGGELNLGVTATIGVAAGRGESLLNRVRLALMEARRQGRNRVFVLEGESQLETGQRETLEWISRVRRALDEGRLVAWFQPIFANAGGAVRKYECLARLVEPDGTVVAPAEFIEAAKLGGFMPRLTRRMAEQAIAALSRIDGSLSINVTDQELRDGSLNRFLAAEAAAGRVEPERLILEVLEGISVDTSDEVLERLHELKRLGFLLAIDDFGAEHSHFSRLLELEADFLKIDGRFVRHLHEDLNAYTICHAVTQLAKALDIQVVAEFVHCREVQEKVVELGIDYSQGFHLGEPRPELPFHE